MHTQSIVCATVDSQCLEYLGACIVSYLTGLGNRCFSFQKSKHVPRSSRTQNIEYANIQIQACPYILNLSSSQTKDYSTYGWNTRYVGISNVHLYSRQIYNYLAIFMMNYQTLFYSTFGQLSHQESGVHGSVHILKMSLVRLTRDTEHIQPYTGLDPGFYIRFQICMT